MKFLKLNLNKRNCEFANCDGSFWNAITFICIGIVLKSKIFDVSFHEYLIQSLQFSYPQVHNNKKNTKELIRLFDVSL